MKLTKTELELFESIIQAGFLSVNKTAVLTPIEVSLKSKLLVFTKKQKRSY